MAQIFEHRESGYSNCYKLKLAPNGCAYRYDVEMIGERANGCSISLTAFDETRKKAYGHHDEIRAYSLLSAAYDATGGFGHSSALRMVYDNRTTLFTNKKIEHRHMNIHLLKNEYGIVGNEYVGYPSVNVMLKFNKTLEFNDPRFFVSDFSAEDRDLRQFLELLTTQPLIDSALYFKDSNGDSFNLASPVERRPGILVLKRIKKGVSLIKDVGGSKMAVTVEVGVCPFFNHATLTTILVDLFRKNLHQLNGHEFDHFLTLFKNVKVVPNYNKSKYYNIKRLSASAGNTLRFTDQEGLDISVVQYYHQHHGIVIKHPYLPMLEVDARDGHMLYFPLELLTVLPAQRVPSDKFDIIHPLFCKDFNQLGAMNPTKRSRMIDEAMKEIHDLELFKCFGITFDLKSNKIDYGIRHTPTIANATSTNKNGSWNIKKYSQPGAPFKNWIVLYGAGATDAEAKLLVKRIRQEAGKKSVQIGEPKRIVQFRSSDGHKYWEEQFKDFKKLNLDILFLVDADKKSHGLLKLFERKFEILTQHVTTFNVKNEKNFRAFENVFHKTHEKLGGLNSKIVPEKAGSSLSLDNNKIMVFGYDVSHPKQVSGERSHSKFSGLQSLNPSVVGLSFNCGKYASNFIGDYFFQTAKKEAVDATYLEKKIKMALEKWKMNRKVPLPETIFIFRDGISEGQYKMAIDDELAVFRRACRAFNRNFMPKFVLVIATKNHLKRFFKQDSTNIGISSVIDRNVVRHTVDEFFIQSANPLMGTAKPPNVVTLSNEPGYSKDQIQSFAAYLCYEHQIVTAPISLPEPIKLAHELAKRGANNLEEWVKINPMPRDIDGLPDTGRLNEVLCYEETQLSNQRFNA